jgi:gluconate 2-dehydrogenase gamma chain
MTVLSRRDLLKLAGMVGATAVVPDPAAAPPVMSTAAASGALQAAARVREPLQALTATEADLLDAVVARLIPADANGPGAAEAQAVRYIDRALAGALGGSREAYRTPFTSLSPTDQDSVLIDVETGAATGSGAGFQGSSAQFFVLVRTHTLQGTFGDPFYGGNANFVGWDMLGYPGVRTAATADDQRLGVKPAPTHKSAYDHDMFTKATAMLLMPEKPSRGD